MIDINRYFSRLYSSCFCSLFYQPLCRAEADGDAAGDGGIVDEVQEETLLADPLALAQFTLPSTDRNGGAAAKGGAGAAGSGASAAEQQQTAAGALKQSAEDRQLLKSSVTHEQWALHLEAMLPRLRVRLEGAVKEWHSHLDDAIRQRSVLAQDVPEACATLDRLAKQLTAQRSG